MTKAKDRKRRPRAAGRIRVLASGRYQARFTGPDGILRPAAVTFETKEAAEQWLGMQQDRVRRGTWEPDAGSPTSTPSRFGPYAERWLKNRDLKPRTKAHYRQLLDRLILPRFKGDRLTDIKPADVRRWHETLGTETPTRNAHAYGLLRVVMMSAYAEDIIPANPCRVRGAGSARTVHHARPASVAEIAAITKAMPERLQAMTLLAAWCGLRFGELIELRRGDIDADSATVRVERAAARADGVVIVGTPKSAAGIRTVTLPPHVAAAVMLHMDSLTGAGKDALLFPGPSGRHLDVSALHTCFRRACATAGRDDLRFHDLRHTGATLAASTGATLAALQSRLGHSTVDAAMRYQHAASDADQLIAEGLGRLADATAPRLRAV